MALEGANVIGSFPVYDTSGNIALYGKMLAQQQAKRQAEQKQLQDELGKVKIDGVRDPDKPELYQKYNQWKDTFNQYNNERDRFKKMQLKDQMDRTVLELEDFAAKSKQMGRDYHDFQNRLLDDNLRDQFEDDAIGRVQKANNLPMSHPEFVKDFTTLERQVDLTKFNKEVADLDKQLLDKTKWQKNQRSGTEGNKTGLYVQDFRKADPSAQALTYANNYDVSPKFRVALKKLYPEMAASLPPEQFKDAAIKQLVRDRPITEYAKERFESDWKPDKSGDGSGGSGMKNAPTYRQDLLNKVLDKTEGSLEEMFDTIRGGVRQKGATHIRGNDFKYQRNSNGTITVEIPDAIKQNKDGESEIVIPKTRIVIDPSNRPDAVRKLNNILNTYSDEKVPTSALETPQGKKKVPGGQSEKQFDKKTTTMVTMVLPDGRTGQIPSDKVSDFLKKYPKAKRR